MSRSLYVWLTRTLSLALCLSRSHSLDRSRSLALDRSLSLCLSFSLALSLYIYLSKSFTFPNIVSISHSLHFLLYFPIDQYISFRLLLTIKFCFHTPRGNSKLNVFFSFFLYSKKWLQIKLSKFRRLYIIHHNLAKYFAFLFLFRLVSSTFLHLLIFCN